MRVEWKCVSMTSGGQCVMTTGISLMLLWSVNSWDMHTLEVSMPTHSVSVGLVTLLLSFAGGKAYSNARFGTGSGPIFLDDVQCSSSSNQLLECPTRPILSHNCLHSADAGVGCEGVFPCMANQLSHILAYCIPQYTSLTKK